jgi:hypothetical protein
LPQDFLRVLLNQTQLIENNDVQLAQQLQSNYFNNQYFFDGIRPSYRGRLQFDIIEAKLNKSYGFTKINKMDPYVRVRIGNKIYETPTDYNGGKNPRWNKTLMW